MFGERGLLFIYSCFACTEDAGIGAREETESELEADQSALQTKEF
jgi:hypothetical protein